MAGLLENTFIKGTKVYNSSALTINAKGTCGIIILDANVNYAPQSNQSSSIWLYMSTLHGINMGYTSDGISVTKIASLKHDFDAAITNCSLTGSIDDNTIIIEPGSFNTFNYIIIPL
ncbi:MAG: hypothetical protein IJN06_06900 [Bacteroidales bacterium]|nr:hypothetical protein [Bacteroidales bacterium]